MESSVKQRGFSATHGNRKRTPFLLICHNASKFGLLSAFSLMKTIWPKIWAKSLPKNENTALPRNLRPSKTSLLRLTNNHLLGASPPVLYLINSRNFSLSSLETFPTCLFVASVMYFSLGNVAKDRTGLKLIVSQGTGQVHLSSVSL